MLKFYALKMLDLAKIDVTATLTKLGSLVVDPFVVLVVCLILSTLVFYLAPKNPLKIACLNRASALAFIVFIRACSTNYDLNNSGNLSWLASWFFNSTPILETFFIGTSFILVAYFLLFSYLSNPDFVDHYINLLLITAVHVLSQKSFIPYLKGAFANLGMDFLSNNVSFLSSLIVMILMYYLLILVIKFIRSVEDSTEFNIYQSVSDSAFSISGFNEFKVNKVSSSNLNFEFFKSSFNEFLKFCYLDVVFDRIIKFLKEAWEYIRSSFVGAYETVNSAVSDASSGMEDVKAQKENEPHY